MFLEKFSKIIHRSQVCEIDWHCYQYTENQNIHLYEKDCILIVFPKDITKDAISSFADSVITQDFISDLKNTKLLLKCCKSNRFKKFNNITEKIPEHDTEYIIPLTNKDEVKEFIIKKIV